MPSSMAHLAREAAVATEALAGKIVARVVRHRESEVLVKFTDGSRLFADAGGAGLEIPITSPHPLENP